jgi:DNA-binding transcriptional LysR family regulator
VLPQYVEQYFLLRRRSAGAAALLQLGEVVSWREAAAMPQCLLTHEMHNRTIIDAAFRKAGFDVKPAIETNSIVTVVLSVLEGEVCAVLPGALMALVRGYPELEALPLREPDVRTPIGFMIVKGTRESRALEAALALAADGDWLRRAAAQGGMAGF